MTKTGTWARPNPEHLAAQSDTPAEPPKRYKPGPYRNPNGYTLPEEFQRDRNNVWSALIRLATEASVDAAVHVLIGIGGDNQAVHFDRLKQAGALGFSPSAELVGVARDVGGLAHFRKFIEAELRKAMKAAKAEKTQQAEQSAEEGNDE